MNLKNFIPCNLILLFFITSCSFTTTINPILDSNQSDPPCWNNIIPGKTTADEAEAILKTLKSVDKGSIVQATSSGVDYDFFVFSLVGYKNVIGRVYFRENIVYKTGFIHQMSPIDNGGLFNLTLHDMQEYIGEPAYISIIRIEGDTTIIKFDDKESGINYGLVSGGLHSGFPNLLNYLLNEITPNSYINNVQYYEPNLDKLLNEDSIWDLYKWNGFGNLDEKYPLSDRIIIQ